MEPGPAAAVGTAGAVGAAANASAPAAAAAAAAGALSSGASVGYCPVPLPLSDSEQQCYSELFARCCCASATTSATTSSTSSSSSSSSGHTQPPPEVGRGAPLPGPTATAGANQVGDLFRASQLPAETLHQITELCGAKRVGYFGPTQFYVALKLIAAAQSGLPVRIESIKCELPLPRFMAMKNDSEIRYSNPAELHGVKCQIPYVTMEKNSFKRMDDAEKQQETMSPTMSPISSPPSSPSNYQRVPLTYGYGKLRSGMEQIHSAPYEARQLALQQEGPTSGSHGAKPPRLQTSLIRSLSVEREPQESNSNYPDDPWRITEEQREYYINQFKSLQPDLSSFISGSLAKNFFTKSKLTIPELSYIWELSDVDCDGALTLPEFCAAFHLIVARKNGYPLPESLPQTLQPDYVQTAFIKPKRDCALFDSYSESMTVNQQPRDLNRIEKTSIKEKADLTAGAQDVNTDDKQAAKPGLLPPPPALPPRPFVSQALHHNTSSDSVSQPKPPGQLPGYGDFRLPEQTDQVPEIELHPQLTRTPSQPEESGSPVKKDLPHTQPPSKPIRRKFRPENQVMENQEPPSSVSGTSSAPAVKPHAPVQKQSSKQKKAIQTAIRKNKEANAVLARLNSELQQQLKEVHQERIALENQLEQLRPVTVL
ncbi:ralBP1-associated Eps domain-containing protein 2 isoform X5 [Dromiciops gliroides]|uniref:ralBP1-associated Eps domain-containing protein 2 isoform X5 n=1 Tax=Dromiciops gliroides TaxID=33562 RepID=UPI001CC361B2|nr:ralBP1-associated Eps domain-containing protein 2 isoform X5 [Dromiciops gliroides]